LAIAMPATGAPGCVAIRPARTIRSRSGTYRVSRPPRRHGFGLASKLRRRWSDHLDNSGTGRAHAARNSSSACLPASAVHIVEAEHPHQLAHDVVVAQLADRRLRRGARNALYAPRTPLRGSAIIGAKSNA